MGVEAEGKGGVKLQWFVGALVDEVYDSLNVEGDDGFLAFVGFQEGQAEGRIHEPVFREYRCAEGGFEDVIRGFDVGITVGEVGS